MQLDCIVDFSRKLFFFLNVVLTSIIVQSVHAVIHRARRELSNQIQTGPYKTHPALAQLQSLWLSEDPKTKMSRTACHKTVMLLIELLPEYLI